MATGLTPASARPYLRVSRSALIVAVIPLLAGVLPGCGSKWRYTYAQAEKLARSQEKPILVCYRDHLDRNSTVLMETLESAAVRPQLNRFVLCSLISAYPQNRKYMAQYGVLGTPALVIVHPDGTYHALTDVIDAKTIAQFLSTSTPPGAQPRLDIGVPRPTDQMLRAEGIYERAEDKAKRLNRPMLILFKWWLDPDSTEMIARMTRPEVAARCTETVSCILDWDYVPNRTHVARYGVKDYPALIVVNRDGSYKTLKGEASVDQIVGFLTDALSTPRRAVQAAGGEVPRPGWQWSTVYESARRRAAAEGTGLLVFCHASNQQESATMMRRMQSATTAALFTDTVRCSLSWSEPESRATVRRFGVEAPPALVAVRPDGTYLVRAGVVGPTELQELHQFLNSR